MKKIISAEFQKTPELMVHLFVFCKVPDINIRKQCMDHKLLPKTHPTVVSLCIL